jgi:hypothetical protein
MTIFKTGSDLGYEYGQEACPARFEGMLRYKSPRHSRTASHMATQLAGSV